MSKILIGLCSLIPFAVWYCLWTGIYNHLSRKCAQKYKDSDIRWEKDDNYVILCVLGVMSPLFISILLGALYILGDIVSTMFK